jgi:hypothetical protein
MGGFRDLKLKAAMSGLKYGTHLLDGRFKME